MGRQTPTQKHSHTNIPRFFSSFRLWNPFPRPWSAWWYTRKQFPKASPSRTESRVMDGFRSKLLMMQPPLHWKSGLMLIIIIVNVFLIKSFRISLSIPFLWPALCSTYIEDIVKFQSFLSQVWVKSVTDLTLLILLWHPLRLFDSAFIYMLLRFLMLVPSIFCTISICIIILFINLIMSTNALCLSYTLTHTHTSTYTYTGLRTHTHFFYEPIYRYWL